MVWRDQVGETVLVQLADVMRVAGAVRRFSADPVPLQLVYRLLDDARFAPSGGNRQPWRVIVVSDAKLRAGLGELFRSSWYTHHAPLFAVDGQIQPDEYADHVHEVPVHLVVLVELAGITTTISVCRQRPSWLLPPTPTYSVLCRTGPWVWRVWPSTAREGPSPNPSRSSRIGAHDLDVPTSQTSHTTGEVVDGQRDDRSVSNVGPVRNGLDDLAGLAIRPTDSRAYRLDSNLIPLGQRLSRPPRPPRPRPRPRAIGGRCGRPARRPSIVRETVA